MTPDMGFSPAAIAQFQRDGYVIARAATPPAQCEELLAIARRDLTGLIGPIEYEADTHYPGAPASRDAPGGRTSRRLLQAYARDAAFARWVTSAPIAGRAAQLLGAPALLSQVHHNCVMTKAPAYSSETHWHRDIRYWSFTRPDLVSVWLALGEERVDNGCLLLLPGSHRMEFAPHQLDAAPHVLGVFVAPADKAPRVGPRVGGNPVRRHRIAESLNRYQERVEPNALERYRTCVKHQLRVTVVTPPVVLNA